MPLHRLIRPLAILCLMAGTYLPSESFARELQPSTGAVKAGTDASDTDASDTDDIKPIPVEADRSKLDRQTVYRYDPVARQLWPIPPSSLRVDCIYLVHDVSLGRWTWSQWHGDSGFRYAMGPGSIQAGERFHLTISDAEGRRALEARSPELARKFEIQGAKPVLRLDEDGSWRLNPTVCGARVFDERTGERWEWHGPNRAAVVHLGGSHWRYESGRYLPSR
jgi:hypothetical protein